jgi:tRNA (mo5U34)-methyltransferase
VLDIGCNGGFYSMEMEAGGACTCRHRQVDRYLSRRGLPPTLELSTSSSELSVYDVGALGERFDVVVFMGVLYQSAPPAAGRSI